MGTGRDDGDGSSRMNKVPAEMTPREFSESVVPALNFMISIAETHGLESLVEALATALEVAEAQV